MVSRSLFARIDSRTQRRTPLSAPLRRRFAGFRTASAPKPTFVQSIGKRFICKIHTLEATASFNSPLTSLPPKATDDGGTIIGCQEAYYLPPILLAICFATANGI